MLCSRCHTTSPANNRYCDACGDALQQACLSCGHANRPSAQFCGGCGQAIARDNGAAAQAPSPALPGPLAALLSSRFAREGERKQVTVLFADIRGSTELIQDLDPEQAMQRLEPGLQAMAAAVHQYGGTVSRTQGDGIMALFGAPLAYEDHAVRACLAAQVMIEAMGRLGEHYVDIRVGVNSGEVVVRSIGHDLSMEYDAIGPTTHLAHRMEQVATPGTACITALTARLAGGFIQVRLRGLEHIKGIARPVEVFELIGAVGQTRWQVRAAAHSLTQFVGRGTELSILSDALRRARDGRGQIVAISGESGMGKSRLVHEFLHDPALEGQLSLSGAAMPHDLKTPYQLIAEMLRTWLGVESDDGHAEIDAKLVTATAILEKPFAADLAPLRSLLDLPVQDAAWQQLDPAQRRRQTHDAIRSLVWGVAAARPCILVVEDMHWADPESQSVLDAIIDGLGTARLLVVVTYRPEYVNHWSRHSYYSFIQLGPLEATSSDALLRSLLGDAADLGSLRDRMIKQTDGTPLFLEEMARTLVETGVLVSEPTRFRLTRSVEDVEIPHSVQIVLASRIDRLPSDERTLLQIASVIGRDVLVALLRDVAAVSADQLVRQLLELRSQEFLYEVSGSAGAEYSFKHALTHAVAYDSMLNRHHRTLHGHVMAAIEEKFPERIEEFTERLADHALRGEVWDKAAFYSLKAGQRANSRSAHRAAATFFRQAADALTRLPQDRNRVHQAIDARLGLRVALSATGDLEQVRDYLGEAEALALSIGDERRLMPIHISRSTILNNLGALDEAVRAGWKGREIAERLKDEACFISSGFALGQAFWNQGELQKAEDILSRSIKPLTSDSRKGQSGTTGTASVLCLVSLSHTHCFTGRFDQAFTRSRQALDVAKEMNRPYDLSYAGAAEGLARLTAGELGAAIHHLEQAWQIAHSNEIMLLTPHVARYLGRAYALVGRLDDADALLVKAVDQARSQSLVALHGWCATALGLTRALSGAYQQAEALVSDTVEFARRQGYRPLEAHAMRLLGVINAMAGNEGEAMQRSERWFRDAAALARSIGMTPELAHCHHGLGDLLVGCGRVADGQAELAKAVELYGSCGMAAGAAAANASLAVWKSYSEPFTAVPLPLAG